MKMDRKTFLEKTPGAVLVTLPLYGAACSNDDSANGNGGIAPQAAYYFSNGANATSITINHASLVVKADIDTGLEKSYAIQGGSGHNYTIALTSSNFDTLKSIKTLKAESSHDSGHSHDLSVSCA